MRLVRFHYVGPNDPLVFINPEHVVAVGPFPSSPHIYVSVLQKDGGPSYYPIKETLDEVVKLLTA